MKKELLKINFAGRLREACQRLSPRQSLTLVMGMVLVTFILCVAVTTRSVLRFQRGSPKPLKVQSFDTMRLQTLDLDSTLNKNLSDYENDR